MPGDFPNRNLQEFVPFLEERGELIRIPEPVDPHLEITEICDRTLRAGGPALLFERPKGHRVPVLGNLFGTPELESVLRVLSLDFVLIGFAVIPTALLTRRLDFRTLAIGEIVGPDWRLDDIHIGFESAAGDRLGGHLVTGHVDGMAHLVSRHPDARAERLEFQVPPSLARYVARKGSVCLDGVSLTVNEVDGCNFSVCLIPHTLEITTLGDLQSGDPVNLEVDLVARYLERLNDPDLQDATSWQEPGEA